MFSYNWNLLFPVDPPQALILNGSCILLSFVLICFAPQRFSWYVCSNAVFLCYFPLLNLACSLP
jgi:hypothetical protein